MSTSALDSTPFERALPALTGPPKGAVANTTQHVMALVKWVAK